jgi:cytochrome c oxidase cbb3-type subunit 2
MSAVSGKHRSLWISLVLAFASSWAGLVVVPYFQIGNLYPVQDEITGGLVPPSLSGLAEAGRKVYASNGCVHCHSQQVRVERGMSDVKQGWGARPSVARDYINEGPVFLGDMRIGPDLTNFAARGASEEKLHLHLYGPADVTPGSVMPSYRYLYRKQRIAGEVSADALKLDNVEPGYEIVPTRDAKALVAYLRSLDKSYGLPEAPSK